MSEIEKYYNGEIIVDFEEETELEKNYNKVAELYSKAVKKKIEYREEIERLKGVYEKNLELVDKMYVKDKEIERLNNIINEVRKKIKLTESKERFCIKYIQIDRNRYDSIIKLLDKGDKNNGNNI